MRIPEQTIDQIREATDIIEVISQYVSLKKRGKSYLGLCPFHTEKTPSFNVDPVRGFYHCFGCKAGGNVFTFVMQMERVGFTEAIRLLAKKAGIAVELVEEDEGERKETEVLYHANRFAAEFFEQCLHETRAGKRALQILSSRGFNMDTIRAFHMGYAPDLWDGLIRKAGHESLPLENLARAGLIVKRTGKTGYYDRFRGRLMFPVLNPSGNPVGFGGRVIKTLENTPKYINSPETPIYQKSRILYGLYESLQGIRREQKVIIVEGYTDVMQLHQSGFDFAVASAGTALTEDQARILLRYTQRILLVFDGDSAGFAAALRGMDILLKAGLDVTVVTLPKGTDPDSYLKQHGGDAMKKVLGNSRSIIDYYLERFRDEGRLASPEEKAQAGITVLNTIVLIKDPIRRNLMIKDLSEKLGISENLLVNQIGRVKENKTNDLSPSEVKITGRQKAEQSLLAMLIKDGDRWARPVFHFLSPVSFTLVPARTVVEKVYNGYLEGYIPGIDTLMKAFVDDVMISRYIIGLLNQPTGEESNHSQLVLDCLIAVMQDDIQQQIDSIRDKIRKTGKTGDSRALQEKYMKLRREWENIKEDTVTAWKKGVGIH